MICEGENGINGCHLSGFSEDIAFAQHPPILKECYASKKLSKMAGNSASYHPTIGEYIDYK